MAHDFTIRVPNDEVFFFGYADGIFIKLLDARNVIMQCLVMNQYI